MKKIQLFSAAFLLLAASACEKEQQEVQNPISGELTTITALAQESETKAYVDGLQVKWSTGDVLAVADEDDAAIEFPLVGGANTATATFNGDLGGKALGNYAVYPNGANASFSGTTVYTDYLSGWDYGKAEIPMYGINDGTGKYSFYNIGGALKVTYSNVPAESKKFVLTETHTGGAEKYITGAVEVDDLDTTPSVEFGYLDGQTVTVNNVTSGDLALVIPIPTGTGYNFNVKLIDASSKTIPGSEKNASNVQIKENKLKSFPEIAILDSYVMFEERFDSSTGSIGTFNSGNGTYTPDNDGWSDTNAYGAGSCAKYGTSSINGDVTSPSIAIPSEYRNQPVSLHFKAACWNNAQDTNSLDLTVTGATADETSFTTSKTQWTEYDVILTSLSSTITLEFEAGGRFFLDDVIVFFGPSVPAARSLAGISYSTTSYAAATGGAFVAPTLNNPNSLTGIEYSSNDTDIASVNSSTGEVTIGSKTGTVRITATFAGNASYRPGSAYYDIDVSDPVYVNYWINGAKTTVAAAEGQSLDTILPANPSCGIAGYQFAGWSESTVATTDTEPTYTSKTEVPAGGLTVYAVFVVVGEEDVAENDVTYDSGDYEGRGKNGGGSGSNFSHSEGGVSFVISSGYEDSSLLKIYSGATLSISASRNITGISIAFTTAGYAKMSGSDFSISSKTGTWSGTATKSVTLSATAQSRMTSIVVTLAAGKITTYSGYTTTPVAP